jgi:hypothetical protein
MGGEVQASQVNAAATIIDLQELDRSVRGDAAGLAAPATNPVVTRKAAFLAQHIGRNDQGASGSTATVPSIKSTRPAIAKLPDLETQARDAYELAQQAESRGQSAAARINYKRAASLSRGKLRADALARLAALSPPNHDTKSPLR